MRTSLLIICLILILTGCAPFGYKVYTYNNAYHRHMLEAGQIGDDTKELDEATIISHVDENMDKAIQTLKPGSFDYYFAWRYVPHAHALATKGCINARISATRLGARRLFGGH